MTRQYFGTDGIRGTVGHLPITPDFMLRLAHAVGQVLKRHHKRPTVLIGKDTRISGYMLESALEAGFNSAGVDVLLLGPIPTPAVAYLTRAQRATLGVVISASHNAFQDNGIKFFNSQGSKLDDAWEIEVEQQLQLVPRWAQSADLGKTKRLDDAAGRYIKFCKNAFTSDLNLDGLKIVVDAAHGAAYQIAPKVFHELGAQVYSIGCAPNGLNINDHVGATHPQALLAAVQEHKADWGIALDGDADRLQLVDANGRLFNGDELLYLMLQDRIKRGEKIKGVVGTLMTNLAIEKAIRALGVEFVRAKVGDRYVLEELEKNKWILGGEGSGHLLALDKHSTGDGLVSSLLVLEACVHAQQTPSQLLQGISLYPQTLINVRLQAGQDWKSSATLAQAQEKALEQLGETGRILIRPSGTEPLLRVMVEAQDAKLSQSCAQMIAQSIDLSQK
ncbi:MAG: phosphoglucosamine mutase [Limnohabitans sp.]|nr:phosphoglucosamine mutase [Limnohabitans sp.]